MYKNLVKIYDSHKIYSNLSLKHVFFFNQLVHLSKGVHSDIRCKSCWEQGSSNSARNLNALSCWWTTWLGSRRSALASQPTETGKPLTATEATGRRGTHRPGTWPPLITGKVKVLENSWQQVLIVTIVMMVSKLKKKKTWWQETTHKDHWAFLWSLHYSPTKLSAFYALNKTPSSFAVFKIQANSLF